MRRATERPPRVDSRIIRPRPRATVRRVKAEIHPEYPVCTVTCSCGNAFETRSTRGDHAVEICSACHPFYTGTQKLIDVGGRVERFNKRRAKQAAAGS